MIESLKTREDDGRKWLGMMLAVGYGSLRRAKIRNVGNTPRYRAEGLGGSEASSIYVW